MVLHIASVAELRIRHQLVHLLRCDMGGTFRRLSYVLITLLAAACSLCE